MDALSEDVECTVWREVAADRTEIKNTSPDEAHNLTYFLAEVGSGIMGGNAQRRRWAKLVARIHGVSGRPHGSGWNRVRRRDFIFNRVWNPERK